MKKCIKYIFLIIFLVFLSGCRTASFTYSTAMEIDYTDLQFYIRLDGTTIPLIGGPVYRDVTLIENNIQKSEVKEGRGTYTETITRKIHADEIRIPLKTPGIYHSSGFINGRHFIEVNFGEGVILRFESVYQWGHEYYRLTTRSIEIDGKIYEYYSGKGDWFTSNYVLDANVKMTTKEQEEKTRSRREIKGKTLEN